MDKKLELIKKIRALADRGVGGEKEGARKKLEELMAKYEIDEIDLNDDDKELMNYFTYKSSQEKTILLQTFYKHFTNYPERTYTLRDGKGSRSTLILRCTKAKAIEIGIEYDFYKELWAEELQLFLSAFIQKHQIFSLDPAEASESSRTPEERRRMLMMMEGLQDKSLQMRLEGS